MWRPVCLHPYSLKWTQCAQKQLNLTEQIDRLISVKMFFTHHWAYRNQSFSPSIWKQKSKQRHKTILLVAGSGLTDNVACRFRVIWGKLVQKSSTTQCKQIEKVIEWVWNICFVAVLASWASLQGFYETLDQSKSEVFFQTLLIYAINPGLGNATP